jgi:hypothetical protein
MSVSLEKIYFNWILNNRKFFDIVEPHFFKNTEIKFCYGILRNYFLKDPTVKIPSPKQIWEMVKIEDQSDIITVDILKSILSVKLDEYDETNFIKPKISTWILLSKMKSASVDIIEEVRNFDNINDFEKAVDVAEKIKEMVKDSSSTNFIGDDDDLGSDFDDVESHVQDNSIYKIKTGFDTIDHMLGGGWDISTLNIIMAATNQGKCVTGDSSIKVKNIETGEIIKTNFEEFFTIIKKEYGVPS